MNRIYRLIWDPIQQQVVVVSEKAKSRGKKGRIVGAVMAAGLMSQGAWASSVAAFDPVQAGMTGVAPQRVAMAVSNALPANTLPRNGTVTVGEITINSAGNVMNIEQATQRGAINWHSFSVGSDATVNFLQPNSSAITLNRVVGHERSVIDGAINANGQVWVLNSHGVLFNRDAQVNVGSLIATTLDMSDADFVAGSSTFEAGSGRGSIINLGTLQAADAGYIALLGQQVANEGVIHARLGTAMLAAADKLTLNFNGDSLVGVTIERGTLQALVENKQAIIADGGLVTLTAKGLDEVMRTVVNNTGEIRAQTIQNKEGRIFLLGGMENDRIEVAGKLDASASEGGNGGFIETSAANVQINDVNITTLSDHGETGTWLIDPTDFDIVQGNISQTNSGIGAQTLESALAGSNVVIQTVASGSEVGNINVNANLTWSANKLTLEAHGDINVNAVVTASGTSTLDLKTGWDGSSYDTTKFVRMQMDRGNNQFTGKINFTDGVGGLRGGDGILTINNQAYTLINSLGISHTDTTLGTLQGMQAHSTKNYALAGNINAINTVDWDSGAGFKPIGQGFPFVRGSFNGLGNTIDNLFINRPDEDRVGIFGTYVSVFPGGAEVQPLISNIGIRNANVTGGRETGIFAGYASLSFDRSLSAVNVFSSGQVTGTSKVGGLFGQWGGKHAEHLYSRANVQGSGEGIGGLIGYWDSGSLSQVFATGDVNASAGASRVGGLIGDIDGTQGLKQSHATGNVTSDPTNSESVGGLIGFMYETEILQSFATGNVHGQNNVGGLIGYNNNYGTREVRDSYAIGNVNGVDKVGGFIGYSNESRVVNSYSVGQVTVAPGGIRGGLIAFEDNSNAIISNSFWNVTTSGIGSSGQTSGSAGGLGKTTAQMSDILTFRGSNPNAPIWNIVAADIAGPYPQLRWSTEIGGSSVWVIPFSMLYSVFSDVILQTGGTFSAQQGSGSLTLDNGQLTFASGNISLSQAQIDAGYLAEDFKAGAKILSQSDMLITQAFEWSDFALSLEAGGDILVNAPIVARGNSTLNLDVGFDGSQYSDDKLLKMRLNPQTDSFSGSIKFKDAQGDLRGGEGILTINGQAYTLINRIGTDHTDTALGSLQGMQGDLNGHYALAGNIDAAATFGWDSGAGFGPIGGSDTFRGSFNGLGNIIDNFYVNRPSLSDVGLFGVIRPSSGTTRTISNVGFVNAEVTGLERVGVLAGRTRALIGSRDLLIHNVFSTGSVTGQRNVGGLTGRLGVKQASDIYSRVDVNGSVLDVNLANGEIYSVGGLSGGWDNGNLHRVFSTGDVTAINVSPVSGQEYVEAVGGLFGYTLDAYELRNAYATGNVITPNAPFSQSVGGLIGQLDATSIWESFATGNVVGGQAVGGLIGLAYPNIAIEITNSYAQGNVSGVEAVGGFIGRYFVAPATIPNGGTPEISISNSYFSGSVIATGRHAAFIGEADLIPMLSNNFWDQNNSVTLSAYNASSAVGLPYLSVGSTLGEIESKTTTQMQRSSIFQSAGWDIATPLAGNLYPTLIWSEELGAPVWQTYASLVTVNAPTVVSRDYDGTTQAQVQFSSINGVQPGEDVTVNASAQLDSANAGNRTATVSYSLSGSNLIDFILATTSEQLQAVITPKALTISGTLVSGRAYDGTTAANISAGALQGLVGAETLGVTGSGVFDSANAGQRGVTVTYQLADGTGLAANYTLSPQLLAALITPKALGVSGTTIADKTFDGTATASVTVGTLQGFVDGDNVNVSASGSFADKNAGQGKSVTVTYTLDNANYTLADETLLADILAKALSISGTVVSNKTYDGNTTASVTVGMLQGLVDGDSVNVSASGSFADKNAGQGKSVTVTYTLDNPNYTLADEVLLADILRRSLSILGTQVQDKVFDGSTLAQVILGQLQGLVGNETLVVSATGTFDSAEPGSRTATVFYSLADGINGGLAANYELAAQTGLTAMINPAVSPAPGASSALTNLLATTIGRESLQLQGVTSIVIRGSEALIYSGERLTAVITLPAALAAAFGEGSAQMVSMADEDEETLVLSLNEAESLLFGETSGAGAQGEREIRVPVSRNSLAEIVNGGVRLPEGVQQKIFLVKGNPQ
ncbi:filamentous hemagglutinin N-terminal domain-containing protein [Alishewanella sp. BS5-314]|uniref:YDG domain-containing protein n=1 Tax=Alishewanella sp. BS5-314 TaxID=2755587 RepID=UPI0021BAB396|nr:YDG domain-containing protein [Alishewanella sp. BS5-314]MCT8124554.1 filamentous hemagglutinin N-terminal domain-containing protein [Alishewanella sp. BS5-314]